MSLFDRLAGGSEAAKRPQLTDYAKAACAPPDPTMTVTYDARGNKMTSAEGLGNATETWIDPVTGRTMVRELIQEPTPDGFPSAWHREAHIAGLRRELAGAEYRAANEGRDDKVIEARLRAAAATEAANARRELEKLGEKA